MGGGHSCSSYVIRSHSRSLSSRCAELQEIKDNKDHVVGIERDEQTEEFDLSGSLIGAFGTKEKPVEVPSSLGFRVVGCQGKPSSIHAARSLCRSRESAYTHSYMCAYDL